MCRNLLARVGMYLGNFLPLPAVASPSRGTIHLTYAAESALHSCASSRAFMAFPPASAHAIAWPVPGGRRRGRPNVPRQSRPAAAARKRWSTGLAMIWRVPARPQNRPALRSTGEPMSEVRTRGRAGGGTGASPGNSAPHRPERVQSTSHAKETKCGGMAAGSRSTLIVPTKPGNWSRGTRPREGKTERGCLMLGPGPGTTSEASYSEPRINVTTQDSSPGLQRSAAWRIHHQRNRMR